ncbi:L,D-transpeptidase Cds6 family protein [Piscinibacter sakaiensis]|uniref:TPR repeat n=1 Tax=Piscinibacter sakaiensis TaxID=1547922 RepID=A0A0K8NZ66_PISS1|nr:hypothetical protein [Piscinibacter sakaiensis]GAP35666.1 TPR repeat precursor [Piscinibacter sakaiensis]
MTGLPPSPPRRWRLLAAGLALALGTASAAALDFGPLRLYLPPGQAPYAEITLSDSAGLDPADIRARIATSDAYGVAGMRYVPALQSIVITPQAGPAGQVVLRLERLPAPGELPEIDLLLLAGDRMSLALGEYRVDLRSGGREFAVAPPGSRLAAAQTLTPATPAPAGVTTSPVTSSAPTSVATAPLPRPSPPPPAPPAPSPAATAVDLEAGEIQAAIDAWAAAWSARDMDGYLAAYTPQYAGRLGSRRAWEEQRRSRILSKKKISVDLDPPQLVARGDTVVATFQQRYRGDEVVERSRKRLVLVKADNRWLIQDETELP